MMKNRLVIYITLLFLFIASTGMAFAADGAPPADPKKHTSLGKYVTSAQAYDAWKASPDKVTILDCRSVEEYAYVGHAPMAVNIPSRMNTLKFDAEKKTYGMTENPDFEVQIQKRFKAGDTIMIMCRSGHRSAASVERLAKIGFTNVYNITDGFEGDVLKDPESYFNGKRVLNGWKNSGAPWTYELKPENVYFSDK
ncbi:MAG: rhodanese-like domain-containing protein [Desulfatirhabdiaceae bacterium]